MGMHSERYAKVAGTFTERARGVPEGAWANPSPCEGWDARDVVRHLTDWLPPFLETGASITLPVGPPVDADPVAAWTVMSDGVQALLDDPSTAEETFDHPMVGRHPLDQAIGSFFLGDVFLHTWDLSRATGQDETLDPDLAEEMLIALEQVEPMIRTSGHYGPRVPVPDDADLQTRLIAFIGRRP